MEVGEVKHRQVPWRQIRRRKMRLTVTQRTKEPSDTILNHKLTFTTTAERQNSFLRCHTHLKTLPDGLIGQPASIAIVVSICKGGLQLAWRCHDSRVLQTHPLGIGEGQTVAVVGRPVVKYHTCGEAQ